MKKYIRHIALVFTLLLLGGIANEAWADVTYIILTKPFNVKKANGDAWTERTNIRLEALRCTSTGTTVYLPDAFRSPLATNFQYWKSATVTANQKLYDDTGTNPKVLQTTYDIYTAVETEMTETSTLASHGDPTIIYVTYDYNDTNTILKLNGTQKYNVTLNTGNNLRFFAFNKNRGNRPAAAKGTTVSAEDLVSNDFTQNVDGFDGTKNVHYQFVFSGLDPYNITIGTAYSGDETFTESLEVEKNTNYKKPYAGSTIFAKLQNNNNNDGTANMWLAADAHRHYKSKTDATVYDSWEGFYKSNMNPIFNAVALLPKGTSYFFVATKLNQNNTIYQPNSSGYYATLSDDGKNPRMIFKALSSAISTELYPIYTYTFKVKTPFENYVDADLEWSDYNKTTTLSSRVPESLKRKYTTFTGFFADAELTNAVSTFADVQSKCGKDGDGKYIIYVDYSVNSLPFETVSAASEATAYTNARWYQMTDKDSSGKKIKWDTSSSSFKNNVGATRYDQESHFAFIGDPYELHIINRALSESNSGNRYVGSTSRSSGSDLTYDDDSDGDGYKWEIPYDAVSGNFTLREFDSDNAYWNWDTKEGSTIQYTTTDDSPTRIKVLELPKENYVYHIVRDNEGTIAVKATASQDVGTALKFSNIPEIIRSPFIGVTGAVVKFYWTLEDAKAKTNAKTSAPFTISSEADKNIYVRYDISGIATTYKNIIDGSTTAVNVRLNGEYLYYDGGTVKSNATPSEETLETNPYLWHLGGSDPYAMTIKNNGASEGSNYVTASATDKSALGWNTEANATKFIIKSGNNGVYEVMYATGESVDAGGDNPIYYNIGRDATGVKIFQNTTYAHGYDQLRFQLTAKDAHNVTYHLIDKENKDLLQVVARHTGTEAPLFPNEYRSPLVAEYHYYTLDKFTDPNTSTTPVSGNAAARYNLTTDTELSSIGDVTDVYVTYDVGDAYDLQNKRTMYLLKYEMGDNFRQEDGSDGLLADATAEQMAANTYRYKAVYPYCNGDGNFFVYGQEQYDIQQQSAASTRTRWAWFLESVHNDPYHVMICSRQIETYNGYDTRAYFRTYVEAYRGSNHVVTNLSWPGISGEQGTEYMILGSAGQFRLVTSDAIAVDLNGDSDTADEGENVRHTVNSFEQYWKTWNTIRLKVLGDKDAKASQSDPNTVPETPAAPTAAAASVGNRTYLTTNMDWHSYEQWAYAIRWNDYNKNGDKNKKGWEDIEHWFQTVNMGEGYFDLVPVTIDPVLILLDQHGWEIMRKALPAGPDDPDKDDKYNAIRPYDSPMVKEYHFWTKASKRSGFHQYYSLSQRVKDNGVNYSSTSLTDLPPFDATNVHDAKGNLFDQYVTYVVKDEYAQGLGEPFMIQQGSNFANNNSDAAAIGTTIVPATGGMSQYIIDNISNLTAEGSKKNELWYLKPNPDIDIEMGYQDATKFPGGYAHDWTNDYTVTDFSASGFDPYNIQISSVSSTSKYFVTNATTAEIDEGSIVGNGTANTLGSTATVTATLSGGMDNRTLQMTNATFMAVQDESGNMQLMPRFDHGKRLKDFSTLTTTTDDADTYTKLYRPLLYNYLIIDNDGNESLRYQSGGDLTPQTPEWFKSQLAKDFKYYTGAMKYSTADANESTWTAADSDHQKTATSDADMKTTTEALTASGTYYFKIEYYKKVTVTTAKDEDDAVYTTTASDNTAWTGADSDHKKTATSEADLTTQAKALTSEGDFFFKIVYYKSVKFNSTTTSTSNGIYKDIEDKVDISNREITESLAGTGLTTAGSTGNNVYVRYSYDEDADVDKVLQGKWLTMTLNGKNAVYSDGLKQASSSKPTPVNASYKTWQWKFLATPQSTPDPYAVSLYNRYVGGAATTVNSKTKFALLNWYDGSGVDATAYTLAEAGTGAYTYNFVNGASMSTSDAATTAAESNFKSTSCSYNSTDAKIVLTDDVEHTYTYKIYTNGTNGDNEVKYGVFAVQADQDNATAVDNGYVPTLPDEIKSPLLNTDQFLYYGAVADMGNSEKELNYLYGLYEDNVYVRYTAYDLKTTEYKVPNVRNAKDGADPVAKGEGSNDASLDINGKLIYNIIWYDDNMMRSTDGSAITGLLNQDLQGGEAFVWMFEGNDPYAIKIKHKNSKHYIYSSNNSSCSLDGSNTSTFMLLPASDSWQYGVLAKTGAGRYQLSGTGNALADTEAATPETPTKFIIFGLSTHKVIYHLVIAKSCPNTAAPAAGEYVDIPYRETKGGSETTKRIFGSSWRDLTTGGGATYQLGSTINGVNYCVDDGHITLGDPLKVPEALERPNCKYFFYVEGVYTNEGCSRTIAYGTEGTHISALDAEYRGLQITEMGTEPELLGTTVRINVVYAFDDGLPTNNGANFVTNTTGTQWYTFETSEETPYLAHYTYKDAKLTGVAGRVGHYTNDFLWSPVGDPYGFKMYNRYVYKNGNETTKVMTTSEAPAADADLIMAVDASANKPVYELLPSYTDGYFKVQTLTIPGSGTPYYIDNSTGTLKLKASTTTEWTFGLSDALLEPYYLGAGNVGGLTTTAKAGQDKSGKERYEAASTLMEKQEVVFNQVNIVDFAPGYYRIFNEPNSLGITIPRYLSGYTHKTELTGDGSQTDAAIPMHFYEREGVTTTFENLGSGYTKSNPTQGQIPIVAPEYDPASIFYITSASGNAPYTMQTQGLYVDGAVMASSAGSNSNFYVTDIGGAVVVLHDGNATIASRYYLNYDQSSNIYDVKYTNNIGIADATKWCLEPANKKGLWIETHSGGEEEVLTNLWYYASYCAPFDMLISNKDDDPDHSSNAYTCVAAESPWSENGLHPKPIGKYTKDDTNYPEEYRPEGGNDYFVPAGTPVLFSTRRATSYIKATIPTTTPSKSISTIFSAKYLEQLLPGWDNAKRVYVFGPKMEGTMTVNESTGVITATLPSLGNTNVGFHINANLNKESGLTTASWTRNNYYVLHNKIYYQAGESPSVSAPSNRAIEFVPVIFDDEEGDEEISDKREHVFDGRVYNLQGRCVATEEQVKDGTWRDGLAPGIYIVNGKKLVITRK